MGSLGAYTIDPVWGQADEGVARAVAAFTAAHGAAGQDPAPRGPQDVVCLVRDAQGEIAGLNSVSEQRVALFGGRRLWVYGAVFAPGTGLEMALPMAAAARQELERGFDPGAGGPIGLCVFVSDAALLERHPEAFWRGPELLYAGYTTDGSQIRLGYFEGALV